MGSEGVPAGSRPDAVFEVAIGPAGEPGRFKVEVVRSGSGEASAVVELDQAALAGRREDLQNAVLASSVQGRRIPLKHEHPVLTVGETLFTALLGTGEVAGRYRAAAAVAAERGQDLRVVLRIDTTELAGLPWEAMYDRAAGEYVCLREQFVRHVPVATAPAPVRVSPPLKILGVISAPRGLPALDVEKERDLLTRALARPTGQGLVEVTWAPATWADLHDLLLAGEWHVLHYIGHGGFDQRQDEGVLVLTNDDGRPHYVEAHRFAGLLRQARPMPRLVVLNSCSGATTGTTDLFSSTAATLTRSGVSAVTAMQYEISDRAATAFARGFYAAIARGRGIDDAVSSGRVAILGTSSHTLEWLTPVLYLRGDHTRLFEIPASGTETSRQVTFDQLIEAADILRATPPTRRTAPVPSKLARILTGHTYWVNGVAFSPDGTLLATTSADHTARIWHTTDGTLARTLTGHTSNVHGVAFSPDGTLLATASGDKTARIWHTTDGTLARTLTGHTSNVYRVAFSPDGTLLATTSYDKTARIWHTTDGTLARTLTGHTSNVYRVAFSPDGTLLATTSYDKTARIWHTADGTLARTLTGHTNYVNGVAFSPDGTLLATTSGDKTARIWHTADGTLARTLTGHTSNVYRVAFSPDGTLLATTSSDKTARIWE